MRRTTRPALAAALALLALIAFACGDDKDKSNQTGAATATPARQPDPATLAQDAATAVQALKSFHFLLDHENGGSPIVLDLTMRRAEGDFVQPDRLKADVDAVATRLGNANIKVQVINVGQRGVISNPFNTRQFIPLPDNVRIADVFDPAGGVASAMRSAKNLRITGEETLNGVKTWRLEGDIDAGSLRQVSNVAEPGYTVKGIAWVGQDRPLVHRVRLEGPLGPKDPPNIVRKIELSKFDENVTIDLPSGT